MFKFDLAPLSFLFFLSFGSYPLVASAQCSADDIRSYIEGGATAEQMNQLCGQQGGGGYPPYLDPNIPVASVCATQWGMCRLAQPLPVGSGCVCYTQLGQIPGIAQ